MRRIKFAMSRVWTVVACLSLITGGLYYFTMIPRVGTNADALLDARRTDSSMLIRKETYTEGNMENEVSITSQIHQQETRYVTLHNFQRFIIR